MDRRNYLHLKLKELIGNDHVYFQPPENIKLKYPCFIYNLSSGLTTHADDKPYLFRRRYELMFITKNPDNELIDKIAFSFPTIEFDRWYTSDNLNHYVYHFYF